MGSQMDLSISRPNSRPLQKNTHPKTHRVIPGQILFQFKFKKPWKQDGKDMFLRKEKQVDEKKQECNSGKSGITTPKTNMSTEK